MKIRLVGKILLTSILAYGLMTTTISYDRDQSFHAAADNIKMKRLVAQFKQGYVPLPGGFRLEFNDSKAVPASVCDDIGQEAWETCDAMWTTYAHGALKYFNNSLCWLNKGATSNVESVLCHFKNSMGINPNLAALPQSITKTFGAMTVNVSVTAPTEAFAVTAGYAAKGVVTVDGNVYMILYWGGTGASTKGFMIEGDVAGLGGDRAAYTKWDLTNDAAQTVQLMSADYPSGTFLSNSSSGDRGDHVIFGSVVYNKNTDAVITQMVLVANKRGPAAGTGFGCFKMYASGTKGGSMVIAKTRDEIAADNFNDDGHAVNSTTLNLTDMDGAQLADAAGTANGTGNLGGANAAGMQANVESALSIGAGTIVFEKSCNDLNTAGSSGVFNTAGTATNFTFGPDDVF